MNTLDIFSTYTMRAVVELIQPETLFFSSRYFTTGAGDIFKSDKVLTEYRKGTRKMAAFVSPRLGYIPVERRGYEIREFEPAYIGLSRSLSVDDLKKRGFGEALYSNSTPAQRAVKLLSEDFAELDRRIRRREEWMCVQTMMHNACTMQEYSDAETRGEVRYVQFYDGTTSEHEYVTANKWNSSSANIIGDVAAMCRLLAKRGLNATDLIIGPDVADVFYKDEEIRKMLDKNYAVNFGTINETITYPGVSTLGRFNFRGYVLTVYVVSTSYDDDDGKDTPYFPADAAMVTFPKCGHLMYGAVTLMPHGSEELSTIAARRVPKLVVDNPHNTRELQLGTRPLAAPSTYCPYIFADKVVS